MCVSLLAHFPIRGEANKYGRGAGEILLDNIACSGTENSLLECDHHDPLMETNCASDHSEDAAVACGGMDCVIRDYRCALSLSF